MLLASTCQLRRQRQAMAEPGPSLYRLLRRDEMLRS